MLLVVVEALHVELGLNLPKGTGPDGPTIGGMTVEKINQVISITARNVVAAIMGSDAATVGDES